MLTYKQKTISTILGVSALFGYLHVEGKEHNPFPTFEEVLHSEFPATHRPSYWDDPLIEFELEDKVDLCTADKDCYKLAEAVVYEARSESTFGQYAVASVILNRVDDPKRWPHTIQGVIHQGNGLQFEYLMNMHKQAKPSKKDWDAAKVVAFDLLNDIMPRVTDANHYLNPRAVRRMPRWTKVYPLVAKIDNHDFHRWN